MNKRQTILAVTAVTVASLFVILSTGCVPPPGGIYGGGGGGGALEWNTNRPGMDMGPGFSVANANQCKNHCNSNGSCRAWTYVKSGHKCWLKHGVPAGQPNNCCTSGVKTWGGGGGGGGGGSAMEWNTNRPGMDMGPGFSVANANQCKNHCNSNGSCRAWTYVKSGHKCWLKHNVPAAQANSCCTSGVKTWGGGGGGVSNFVNNRNRPGMDMGPGYTVANAGVCRSHCNSNGSCRAWTYVKSNHKCWLKNGIPAEHVSTCCVSGRKP